MVIVCNVNIFAKTYEENENGGEKNNCFISIGNGK